MTSRPAITIEVDDLTAHNLKVAIASAKGFDQVFGREDALDMLEAHAIRYKVSLDDLKAGLNWA